MKKLTIIIALILSMMLSVFEVSALSNKIMLKGNVLNKSDNTPLNTEITFKEPGGKEINTKSNNGKYEILLDANVKYDLFINSENTIRYQTEYFHESNSSYLELTKDFYVSKIEEGAIISHIKNAFLEGNFLQRLFQNLKK
jgi:hypothetical protein